MKDYQQLYSSLVAELQKHGLWDNLDNRLDTLAINTLYVRAMAEQTREIAARLDRVETKLDNLNK